MNPSAELLPPSFTGTKNEYMQALDVADNLSSGFQNLGTWTPNALSGPVPCAQASANGRYLVDQNSVPAC